MTTPDDPEQRIRDLEPPAVETARYPGPVETGPPTWTYGGPVPPPSAGTDRRWVSNLLLILGLLVIVGAVAAYLLFGRQPEPGKAVMPANPGTSASRPATPSTSRPPRTITIPTPPSLPSLPVIPIPPQGDPNNISGIDENRTVTCDGDTVTVSGISNTVVITGHCARLTVSGIENVVTVDSADVIEASGLNNEVTFHSGSPDVNATGSNSVEQG